MERLSRDDAKRKLVECLESGQIHLTRHFREELANEDLVAADYEFVMRSGSVRSEPEWDVRFCRWKYTIEGYAPDRQWVAVVFTAESRRATLITIFTRK